jgi:hypothetical protein
MIDSLPPLSPAAERMRRYRARRRKALSCVMITRNSKKVTRSRHAGVPRQHQTMTATEFHPLADILPLVQSTEFARARRRYRRAMACSIPPRSIKSESYVVGARKPLVRVGQSDLECQRAGPETSTTERIARCRLEPTQWQDRAAIAARLSRP